MTNNNFKKKLISTLLILGLLVIALLVRAYRITSSYDFSGELGENLLTIKNYINEGIIPLLGPQTSHPWLNFGPLYYWLIIPIEKIFGFDPLVAIWVGIICGVGIVFLNYIFVRNVLNKKIALISSFLIATSPLFIDYSRTGRFYFFSSLLFYPLFWALYLLWMNNFLALPFVMSIFSIMLNFHYSPLFLIPPVAFVIFKKAKKLRLINIIVSLCAFIVPQIPFLIADAGKQFEMSRNLILWIPYRLAGFLHLYPKNYLTISSIKQMILLLSRFLSLDFYYQNSTFLALVILLTIFIYLVYRIPSREKSFELVLGLSLISGFITVIVLGDAQIHYLLPILPVPIIIVSVVIEKLLIRYPLIGLAALLILITLSITNISHFIVKTNQLVSEKVTLDPLYVPISIQKDICRQIIFDAEGKSFSLKRVGPYDYFLDNYSYNYRYLLWLMGNEPQNKSNLVYSVIEDSNNYVFSDKTTIYNKDIIVVRERL